MAVRINYGWLVAAIAIWGIGFVAIDVSNESVPYGFAIDQDKIELHYEKRSNLGGLLGIAFAGVGALCLRLAFHLQIANGEVVSGQSSVVSNELSSTVVMQNTNSPKVVSNQSSVVSRDLYSPAAVQKTDNCKLITDDSLNLPELIAQGSFQIFIGIQGSGKGVLASNGLEALKKMDSKVFVFYVDPKGEEKESGYFDDHRVDDIARMKARRAEPQEVVAWFKSAIAKFEKIQAQQKLLVIDETTMLAGKFKLAGKKEHSWLKDTLMGLVCSGDSEGIRIWLIAQNSSCEDLGLNSGLRSQFTPIVIISQKNLSALAAIYSTTIIPHSAKKPASELQAIIDKSPDHVRRCFYHGQLNRWLPMQELPNFSGYSRDSRSAIIEKGSNVVQLDFSGDQGSSLEDYWAE